MKKYVVAIDQGTTSTRAIVFDKKGNVVTMSQIKIPLSYPQPGFVEQDANDIWLSTYSVLYEVLHHDEINSQDVAAIGITNQRETVVIWDKTTGEPLTKAIVWQSRQSVSYCEQLIRDGYEKTIKEKTGLVINPYFTATKIKYLLDHTPGLYEKAKAKQVLAGTIDCFLMWKLTNGRKHITDYSNASRTMLFNINTLKWDQEILDLLDIPLHILPEVVDSSCIYDDLTLFEGFKIPLAAMIGDQQAALFGHGCFEVGEVKNTYGTGCFMLMNTGQAKINSSCGLLSTIAWRINNQVTYALEGSVFIAGAAIEWLCSGINLINQPSDINEYTASYEGSSGVYFVPAFVGLAAPYWDNEVRGTFLGITGATMKKHLIYSTIEAICYQSKDVMMAMVNDAKLQIKRLGVDGGVSNNPYLLQFQSDILGCCIKKPICVETTALGAAYLAGLAVGFYQDLKTIKKLTTNDYLILPKMTKADADKYYNKWLKAVEVARGFK